MTSPSPTRGPERRHVLSFLVPDPCETARLAVRARAVLREGTLFVIGSAERAAADAEDALGGVVDGRLLLDGSECRIDRATPPSIDAALCAFPALWMTDAQRREAMLALGQGGTLFVFVAPSGEAARSALRVALRALGQRVRLHEFTARWAGMN